MAEIAVPDVTNITLDALELLAPAQINRSAWTGGRKVVGLPGAEVWSGKVTVGPIATEDEERPWRAFQFGLRGPQNWFKMLLPCQAHSGNRPTVASGASNGYTLPLTGMTASTTILPAGSHMTVPLPSGRIRTVVLTAALVANGSGAGTATFEPALTEVPTLAATVETKNPYIAFSAVDPAQGFAFSNGVSSASFDVEEMR